MNDVTGTYGQYLFALKKAKENVRHNRRHKLPTYLEVLDEKVDVYKMSMVKLGEIDVPADLIVGTKTLARAISFSNSFMPLMDVSSEFAYKWENVCAYHLSDAGISDAPTAYEYLGKFYIVEGNKRVSVLKSYGAVLITLDVTRLIPPKSNDSEIVRYYEFLDFYELSKLYTLQFTKEGYYKKLEWLLGFEENHVWTRNERIKVVGFYERLEWRFKKNNIEYPYGDCFLALLELYGYEELLEMNDKDIDKAIVDNKTRLTYGHGPYGIMCIADEEDLGLYSEYVKTKLKNDELIISCGDLKPEYLEFLVTMTNKTLLYIHGNHDSNYDNRPPEGCICIDDDLYIYEGIRILGLGGSIRYSEDKYQYTEKEMERRIKKLRAKIKKAKGVDIVVTHAPVKGHGDLLDYAHQGFACFERLLNELKPKYWLYGHVHLTYNHKLNRFIRLNGTTLVNCSGKQEITY